MTDLHIRELSALSQYSGILRDFGNANSANCQNIVKVLTAFLSECESIRKKGNALSEKASHAMNNLRRELAYASSPEERQRANAILREAQSLLKSIQRNNSELNEVCRNIRSIVADTNERTKEFSTDIKQVTEAGHESLVKQISVVMDYHKTTNSIPR